MSHTLRILAQQRRLLVRAALVMVLPASARAQSSAPDECFGFSFGPFSPPLDRVAAGHPPTAAERARGGIPEPPRALPAPAAGGAGARDGAIRLDGDTTSRDSTMLLFPSWWPAGVAIRWEAAGGSRGDTLVGVAHALVADGRVRVPRSSVRGWRVPCGRAARSGNGAQSSAPTRSQER